jgi:hypothetical protein
MDMSEREKFAEGPWEIVPYGDGDSLVIHSDDQNRVCFMATHGGSRASWERIQANASLIAAAPALYEALEETAFRLRAATLNGRTQEEQDTLTKAAAVLSQAQGVADTMDRAKQKDS